MAFLFKDLVVYQKSLEWAREVEALGKEFRGKLSKTFLEQLSRASLSIPLNIAEGNGRWHKADKRQFFYIARGSAFECVPILDLLRQMGYLDDHRFSAFHSLLDEIARLLTGLIKSTEKSD